MLTPFVLFSHTTALLYKRTCIESYQKNDQMYTTDWSAVENQMIETRYAMKTLMEILGEEK